MQNYFKKISLLLAIIFFAFCLAAFFFLYKKINSNNTGVAQSVIELGNEIKERNRIETLNYSIELIKKDKALFETHFAQSSDIVPFLDSLEALGSQAGAKAEVTSVDILKDGTGLMAGVKTSGNFESLYKFLMLLENFPYELEFVKIDMQKEAVAGDKTATDSVAPEPKWRADFSIKLLSFIK